MVKENLGEFWCRKYNKGENKFKKMKKIKIIMLIVGYFSLFVACKEKDLPDQSYIDFAKKIERELSQNNGLSLSMAFDYDMFEKRVFEGMNLSAKEKKEAQRLIRENTNPSKRILDIVYNGGDFYFVKFYRKNGKPHTIFRTYYNGGISLEDWELGVKEKQVRVYDAFAIISGIHWSEDSRQRIYNQLNVFSDETANINTLIEVNYYLSNDDYRTADSIYAQVIPQMKHNMYARTMGLNLASIAKSYEEVQTLAADFSNIFPDEDRISAFYLMQSAIHHGLIEESIAHIKELIAIVGDDPIYYVYQSWAFQQANENQFALESLDSAITYLPSIFDLYINKLDLYYDMKNYSECIHWLYRIDSLFEPNEEDAAFIKIHYPDLLHEKKFAEWEEKKNKFY